MYGIYFCLKILFCMSEINRIFDFCEKNKITSDAFQILWHKTGGFTAGILSHPTRREGLSA